MVGAYVTFTFVNQMTLKNKFDALKDDLPTI